jgi:ABC-type sugar transport system substrate-binding protein
VGGPREHFKLWIGEMLPNEEQAGENLANLLLDAAEKAIPNQRGKRIHVLGMSGTETDSGAILRNEGLRKALAARPNAELLQIVSAHWFYDEAKEKSELMFRRYPDIDVLWSANDRMALAGIDTLVAMGRVPGRDVMVGGMDWDTRALSAIVDGKMVASIGGQVLEGAWALVLLCDLYHGIDFASERLAWRSEMVPITKENVERYRHSLGAGNWQKLNFKRFSKFYHPEIKSYNLSVDALVQGLPP